MACPAQPRLVVPHGQTQLFGGATPGLALSRPRGARARRPLNEYCCLWFPCDVVIRQGCRSPALENSQAFELAGSCDFGACIAVAAVLVSPHVRLVRLHREAFFGRRWLRCCRAALRSRYVGLSRRAAGGAALTAAPPAAEPESDSNQQTPLVGEVGGLGILSSVSDLPKTEALGIELRQTTAFAAPVSALDGSFSDNPFRINYDLTEDSEENQQIICQALEELLDHFSWKGVTGCAVTKEVAKRLGVFSENNAIIEKKIALKIRECIRKRVAYVHTVKETHAAAYNELVWGETASTASWQGKVVLLCTLGKHVGSVLFNNGRRVQITPINAMPSSSSETFMNIALHLDALDPPTPDDPQFQEWAELVDSQVCEVASQVSSLDLIILIPTGRTARAKIMSAALPKLVQTQKLASQCGCEVALVGHRDEAAVVRGVAVCSLVELQSVQLMSSLQALVNGEYGLQALSEAQLRAIWGKVDMDGDSVVDRQELREVLQMLGLEEKTAMLLLKLDTVEEDGLISYEEFMTWWNQEVRQARMIMITSAAAWRRLVTSPAPEGFGDLILLSVTFTFCRQCHAFRKKMRQFAEQYRDVRFVEIVGNGTIGAMELCSKELGVKVSPAFFVFRRGGELVQKWTGANAERFVERLEECLELEASR